MGIFWSRDVTLRQNSGVYLGMVANHRLLMDPEDMTVEEQEQRAIQLIASACVRIANKAKQKGASPTEKSLDSSGNKLYPSSSTGDRGP